jgi:hypothetical protein
LSSAWKDITKIPKICFFSEVPIAILDFSIVVSKIPYFNYEMNFSKGVKDYLR